MDEFIKIRSRVQFIHPMRWNGRNSIGRSKQDSESQSAGAIISTCHGVLRECCFGIVSMFHG